MHRPRHRSRRSARLYLSLLSVLALVVFACLPALAQAECTDSSCAQYEVEIPSSTGKKPKSDKSAGSEQEPQAEISNQGDGGKKTGGESPSDNENSEETEEGKGAVPPGNGGGNTGGKNGSSGGGNSNGNGAPSLGEGKEVPGTASGEQASHSSGGSSPLVPILIAVAVLAAISIGAVIYRQRRQGSGGSGSQVSPKAG